MQFEPPASEISSETTPVILVVDNDPDSVQFVTDALAAAGLRAVSAASVSEAISKLRSGFKISLLILDWVLDRSGARVIEVARNLDPLLPILVVSGSLKDPRPDVFAQAADAFLAKPYGEITLINQIRQLLRRTQKPATEWLPRKADEIVRLEEIKSRYIQHVVQLLGNNHSLAATKLGVHRQTLAATMKRFEANPMISPIAVNNEPLRLGAND